MFLFVSPFIYKKLKNQIKKKFLFKHRREHQINYIKPPIMSPLCYHVSNNNNTTSHTISLVSI